MLHKTGISLSLCHQKPFTQSDNGVKKDGTDIAQFTQSAFEQRF